MNGNEACLDTNIVIDMLRGRKDIADKITTLEKVYVPIPVLGERYLGAENSSRKAHHLAQIDVLLSLSSAVVGLMTNDMNVIKSLVVKNTNKGRGLMPLTLSPRTWGHVPKQKKDSRRKQGILN
ncbi:MAG: hypothetical protein AAGA66_07960 [Bacteroidota bacterium]